MTDNDLCIRDFEISQDCLVANGYLLRPGLRFDLTPITASSVFFCHIFIRCVLSLRNGYPIAGQDNLIAGSMFFNLSDHHVQKVESVVRFGFHPRKARRPEQGAHRNPIFGRSGSVPHQTGESDATRLFMRGLLWARILRGFHALWRDKMSRFCAHVMSSTAHSSSICPGRQDRAPQNHRETRERRADRWFFINIECHSRQRCQHPEF